MESSSIGGGKLLLEAYVNGAWWDVEQLRIEGGKMMAHFENQSTEYDETICVEHLRPRSRTADENDCIYFLKPNIDVCVFAAHPKAKARTLGFNPYRAWYDAKLITIDRKPHQAGCDCKFYVKFYRANKEDVFNIDHRPLFGSRKRKVGIESIAILQAPCRLKEEPAAIHKPIEMYTEDSSTLRIPAVAIKSIKLQIEELISFSVKQRVVPEFSLKLLREGDLTCIHKDDATTLKDKGEQINLFHSKLQGETDVDCFTIKEQESMQNICSNKGMGCIILCIDKWDSCQVKTKLGEQETLDKFARKSDYSNECHNAWFHNSLSKRPQECHNEIIVFRRSERLTKQSKQFATQIRNCKPTDNHLSKKECFSGKLETHRHQGNKDKSTTRCPSRPSRKKRKIVGVSSQSQYLQGRAQEIEYRQGKQKLALLGQCTSKRIREPCYDVSTLRRSKRLKEQAQKIQNKLSQLEKEKELMKYDIQKENGMERKKKEVMRSNPPFRIIEFTSINGNTNSNTNLNTCLGFNMQAVGIPTQKWMENMPANTSDIDMYMETCDTANLGICMTLEHVGWLSDKCKTTDVNSNELVVPEMETLTITKTSDINVSEEEIINRYSLIPSQFGDGFRRETSKSKASEGMNSKFPKCEVSGRIADFKQSRMPIGNMIPENSLESDNSDRENECLHNLNGGGNHAGEISKKSIPLDMQNSETAFNKDPLHRTDESVYLEETIEQFNMEIANGTAPQIEVYEPIQKHEARILMLTIVGDNSKCNQKFNTICTGEANTENHLEKVITMASHMDASMTVRDTTSVISILSDESNKETKCRRSLKEKPKLKQEARNKQRLLSVGQKAITNEGGIEEEGSGPKSLSKIMEWDSQADQRTSQSQIHALRNSKYLQEGKQSKAGSPSNVALQVEANESMEKHNTRTQCVVISDSADSEEINTNNWLEEVTSSMPPASASKGTVPKTCPVIPINSDNSNTELEYRNHRKDRRKQVGEVPHRKITACLRKEENDLHSSAERENIFFLPISTRNVVSTSKYLLDIKSKFQHLSACIETEIHKPSPPVLVKWSMVEKKNEVHEDLISDLIINEDGFNCTGTIEEQSSDLKNLWEEMEQTLNGDLFAAENMYPTDTAAPGSSAEAEADDDVYSHFCINKHEFILDEEIGIICHVCNFVKTEIYNVFAPFQVWNSERNTSHSRDDFYMDRDFGDIVIPTLDGGSPCHQSCNFSEKHDSVWKIIPELEKKMNAHQKRAFEFLWRNIAGSLVPEDMEASYNDVGGCIIAHAPGTGKSFTIISFLQSYMTLFPRCKPLIIAPKSMLHTWAREFQKWNVNIPVYILNSLRDFKRKENPVRVSAMLKSCKASLRQIYNVNCIAMLHEWHKKESVLVLSYPLFYTLTNEENANSEERKQIGMYLTRSPGLLILDEGHIPRSHRSKIWNLLMKVDTKLRILLSGTLFQNNFEEYFNTLCLARPTFVDRILRWRRHRSKGIQEEQKEKIARRYFVEEIAKKINTRSMERGACRQLLKSMTEDFIDVYKGDVLSSLPGLRTYMVMLRPTRLQETLLTEIDETISIKNGSSLELEVMVSIVSIHPSLFNDLLFTGKYFGSNYRILERFRKDPDQGVKLKFVVQIMELCSCKGEKVLIFCQYIPPLILLEEIFENHFHWSKGEEILLLEGKHSLDERQDVIDKFSQQGGKARVLLASIKACGVGVNLIEASRVILLDPVWNPSCSKQAICRAFRMGQKRFVHVYQLVTFGTLEEEKYEKSVWKERMSNMIYSSDARQHVEALNIEDDVLRQLVEEDRTMFQRIMEQEDIQKHKDSSHHIDIDIDDILPVD